MRFQPLIESGSLADLVKEIGEGPDVLGCTQNYEAFRLKA